MRGLGYAEQPIRRKCVLLFGLGVLGEGWGGNRSVATPTLGEFGLSGKMRLSVMSNRCSGLLG